MTKGHDLDDEGAAARHRTDEHGGCTDDFQRLQSRFRERGEAAWQRYQRTGQSVSADEVLAKLQAKLDAMRRRLR